MLLAAALAPALVLASPSAAPGIHAEHAALRPAPLHRRGRALDPTPATFSKWVYGYYAYWAGSVADLPWDRLTHVALFDVEMTATGALKNQHLITDVIDEALALAEPYGVKIHITVICFDKATMGAVLPDPAKRALAIGELKAMVEATGAHGVSVDFEGMAQENILDLVAFVEELKAVVPEVTVATPPIDWNQAYHYPKLAAAADALFIMGYNFHWSGGDPGPNAPLHGGAPWSKYSLEWSMNDYLGTGIGADKIIMGLPLYGMRWPSVDNSVPGEATGKGKSLVYADAVVEAATYGRHWDEVTHTPYYFADALSQTWYDDAESIEDKITWSLDQGALGIGFWALNYDGNDPDLWDMVAEHTQIPGADTDSGGTGGTDSGTGSGGTDSAGSAGSFGGASGGGTDSSATGGASGSGGDGSGGASAGATSGAGEDPGLDEGGCGCRSTPASGSALGLLLLVGASARRRRRALA